MNGGRSCRLRLVGGKSWRCWISGQNAPMSLPRGAVEWPQIVTAVIAVAAFGLSVFSLLLQRRRPYLEAQFLMVRGQAAVSIRNSGNLTARAPWTMFAT